MMERVRLSTVVVLAGACLAATAALTPAPARACGCTTPPVPDPLPMPGEESFAVNQSAEQIIFEVGQEQVTAHVLIRYAGSPEEFAWIVPVPNVPELALSETYAFGVLDKLTAPRLTATVRDQCPVPQWQCRAHPPPYCPDKSKGSGSSGGNTTASTGFSSGSSAGTDGWGSDSGGTGGGDPPSPPGVDVLDEDVVGDYETVTFAADDSALAVEWLQDNGFIVNETITPYMQPYIDEGMVFVAAKLVAGAEADAIRPLKITYDGTVPMIPLRLTAVAAEPHMTITAWIFGSGHYQARNLPEVMIDGTDLSIDLDGRLNYPMLLSRVIDEAGGRGFLREYADQTYGVPDGSSECCGASDWCGIGADGVCQCPGSDFDLSDCEQVEGLMEGRAMLEDLMDRHLRVTRLTTRLSPEEMTFDPEFEPKGGPLVGPLTLGGARYDLSACLLDIVDIADYRAIEREADCATTYCGQGTCVITDGGPGCECDPGHVARMFTDMDGLPSVTCVPEVPEVDLGAGISVPDVCNGVTCGEGQCVAINGFAACACDEGTAAREGFESSEVPVCWPVIGRSTGPGGKNGTEGVPDLDVCAVVPFDCGPSGWLVHDPQDGPAGVECPGTTPDPEDLVVPPPLTCADLNGGTGSCACTTEDRGTAWWALAPLLLGISRLRRRR